jgi:hypothetical protein
VSWEQRFYDPIILPGRKPLVTLRDAALYIAKLPKAEHDAEQAAMEALLLVAEHGGPTMFARIGVMRAQGISRKWPQHCADSSDDQGCERDTSAARSP